MLDCVFSRRRQVIRCTAFREVYSAKLGHNGAGSGFLVAQKPVTHTYIYNLYTYYGCGSVRWFSSIIYVCMSVNIFKTRRFSFLRKPALCVYCHFPFKYPRRTVKLLRKLCVLRVQANYVQLNSHLSKRTVLAIWFCSSSRTEFLPCVIQVHNVT